MRNFFKKLGIGSIRIIYSVSNKALKIGLGITIGVLAIPTAITITGIKKINNILKRKPIVEAGTDSDSAHLPFFKEIQKIVLQLFTGSNDFSFALGPTHTNDSNNPFALAKISGNQKTLTKIQVFLGSNMNNMFCSGLTFLAIYFLMGPYALDFIFFGSLSYPSTFLHGLNFIGFIRNTSKNLLVAFELDDKKLLQHFLNKDLPKLERAITQKKYQELELDRMINIVDFYLVPGMQTTSVPYSNEELLYLRKLYDFAVSSDLRLYEDNILRQEIDKQTHFPPDLTNLIISYASDFGIGKYDYSLPRKYISDPKVVEFRDAELKLLSSEENEDNKTNEGRKRKKVKVRI